MWYATNNFLTSNLDYSNDAWKLVFYDEFDGTAIDTDTWYTFSPDGGPNCNGTDNCFWTRGRQGGDFKALFLDNNIEVDNGLLKLHVKKEETIWYDSTFDYSAAMIWSKPNFQFLYGRFESRIKMHKGGGFFPAYWLYGTHEIDIIEYPGGKTPTEYPTTVHGNGKQDPHRITSINGNSIDLSQGFHTYVVEWSPHKVEWFVDGHLVRTFYRYQKKRFLGNTYVKCNNYNSTGTFRESKLMGEVSMSVIFNTSVMKNINKYGVIDDNDFPSTMEVDYIRVYQKIPQSGKVDLCDGEIEGSDEICYTGQETYTFSTLDGENSTVTWTTSPNLNVINTSNNEITIEPTSSVFTSGWIEATVDFVHAPCSTKTFTKNLYAGQLIEGTYVSGSTTQKTLQSVNFSNSNSFNITLDNPTNTYTWQLSSGNAAFGNPNANPQWVQIISGSSSASFNISTSTDCGLISRTVAFVHTSGWYRISPNPSSNYIYIEAEEDYEVQYSDETGEVTTQLIQPSFSKVTLYNFNNGEQVFEQNAYQSVKNMTLDISHLPAGQYVLHIDNEYNTTTHQIIVER